MELALGMEVMVMFNISMDLDMENGAWGYIVDIVLDEHEEDTAERTDCM